MSITLSDSLLLADLNPEQREAVITVDRHCAVEAGAGTGKTRVLSRRFGYLLLEEPTGPLEIDQILMLTFTRRAAAQMADRVRQTLTEVAATLPALEPRAQTALASLDRAWITTIDAACARILREFALVAGVDPQFKVLDELEAARLQREVLESLLPIWEREVAAFTLVFSEVRWQGSLDHPQPGEFVESLTGLYNRVRSQTLGDFSEATLVRPCPGEEIEDLAADILVALEELDIPADKLRKGGASIEFVGHATRTIPPFCAAVAEEAWPEAWEALLAIREVCSFAGGAITEIRPLRALVSRTAIDSVIFPALAEAAARPHRLALAELLRRFDESYAAAKARLGMLDFADLGQETLRLLQEHSWVARILRQRFRHILVDEFQDTSPAQIVLLKALSGLGDASVPPAQQARLFVVGDPKQSIYHFRQADLLGYVAFLEEDLGSEEALKRPLRGNYRSRAAILEFVNAFLLNRPRESHTPDSEVPAILFTAEATLRAEADARFASKDRPTVELLAPHWSPSILPSLPPNRRWTREDYGAYLIIATLQQRIDAGETVSVEGSAIPLDWGHIAILARASRSFGPLERACRAFGVPYVLQDGRGFFAAREVTDVLQFLRVLDNPADDIACAAVLRSPLVDCSLPTLFALTRSQGTTRQGRQLRGDPTPRPLLIDRLRVADTLPELDASERQRIHAFLALLEECALRLASEPLPQVLEACYARTQLLEKALAQSDGLRRQANLRKLQELAEGYPLGEGDSLRQFVLAMEEYDLREARIGEAVIDAPGAGALTLLTIHSAKGEEWPVVVLPNLDRARPTGGRNWAFHPSVGLGIKIDPIGAGKTEPTRGHQAIQRIERIAERMEAHRLLYVALTRAQDRLLLAGPWDWEAMKVPPSIERAPSWLAELFFQCQFEKETEGAHELVVESCTGALWLHDSVPLREALVGMLTAASEQQLTPPAPTPAQAHALQATWAEVVARFEQPAPNVSALRAVTEVSDLVTFAECRARQVYRRRWHLPGAEALTLLRESPDRAAPIPARMLGQALHQILERYRRESPSAVLEELPMLAPLILSGFGILPTPPAVARVMELAQQYLALPLFTDILPAADQVWQELPLTWWLPQDASDPDGPRFYCAGTLDLCYRAGDQVVVVDYKSRLLRAGLEADIAREYQLQLTCYASAVQRWLGVPLESIALQLLLPGPEDTIATVTVQPNLQRMHGVVQAFVAAQDGSQLPPSHFDPLWFAHNEACLKCEYRAGCPGAI